MPVFICEHESSWLEHAQPGGRKVQPYRGVVSRREALKGAMEAPSSCARLSPLLLLMTFSLSVDLSQEKALEQMQGCSHPGELHPAAITCLGHIRETYFVYSINSVCMLVSISQLFIHSVVDWRLGTSGKRILYTVSIVYVCQYQSPYYFTHSIVDWHLGCS